MSLQQQHQQSAPQPQSQAVCQCGFPAMEKVSGGFKNPDNAGKVYYACAYDRCRFFEWKDPSDNAASKRKYSMAMAGAPPPRAISTAAVEAQNNNADSYKLAEILEHIEQLIFALSSFKKFTENSFATVFKRLEEIKRDSMESTA
jgi:hypothetical protein